MPLALSWCFERAGMGERMPCLAYIACLAPVIGASGYSADIVILSWTLSRYRDSQKVHDSNPTLHQARFKICKVCTPNVAIQQLILAGNMTADNIQDGGHVQVCNL